MDAGADPRFVAMFQRAWGPALSLAAAVVGEDNAEEVTVEGFAKTLERWHRLARRPDPDGKALSRTAAVAVKKAKRGVTAKAVDQDVRSAVMAMPKRVAVPFVLHYLGGYADVAVASALRTSERQARKRAARGLEALRREAGPRGHALLDG